MIDTPLQHSLHDYPQEWLDTAITTEEASQLTGVSAATLTTLRSRGGGPPYLRPKGTRIVRYFRRHLLEWLLSGGLKRNTCDGGVDE